MIPVLKYSSHAEEDEDVTLNDHRSVLAQLQFLFSPSSFCNVHLSFVSKYLQTSLEEEINKGTCSSELVSALPYAHHIFQYNYVSGRLPRMSDCLTETRLFPIDQMIKLIKICNKFGILYLKA